MLDKKSQHLKQHCIRSVLPFFQFHATFIKERKKFILYCLKLPACAHTTLLSLIIIMNISPPVLAVSHVENIDFK